MVYTAVPLLPMIPVNMRCFGCGDTDVGEKQNPPVYRVTLSYCSQSNMSF